MKHLDSDFKQRSISKTMSQSSTVPGTGAPYSERIQHLIVYKIAILTKRSSFWLRSRNSVTTLSIYICIFLIFHSYVVQWSDGKDFDTIFMTLFAIYKSPGYGFQCFESRNPEVNSESEIIPINETVFLFIATEINK